MTARTVGRLTVVLPLVSVLAGGGIVVQQQTRLVSLRRELVRAKAEYTRLSAALGHHRDPDALVCHDPTHHHSD